MRQHALALAATANVSRASVHALQRGGTQAFHMGGVCAANSSSGSATQLQCCRTYLPCISACITVLTRLQFFQQAALRRLLGLS